MPLSVLSDNGGQFADFKQGYTLFEKRLMCLDILPIHVIVKHPQTQGKIERFHRTLNEKLLKYKSFDDIEHIDKEPQAWREKYNTVRPHEALNILTPAAVYEKSSREYTEKISNYEYSGKYPVLRVNFRSHISFDFQRLYFSETFAGECLEFRPNFLGDPFFAFFRNFRIAEFYSISGNKMNRSIYKL